MAKFLGTAKVKLTPNPDGSVWEMSNTGEIALASVEGSSSFLGWVQKLPEGTRFFISGEVKDGVTSLYCYDEKP